MNKKHLFLIFLFFFVGLGLIVLGIEVWGPGISDFVVEHSLLDSFDSQPIPGLAIYTTITGADFHERRSRGRITFSHNTDRNLHDAVRSSVTIGMKFPDDFYDKVIKGNEYYFRDFRDWKPEKLKNIKPIGSGFALDSAPGKIVTAAHVVALIPETYLAQYLMYPFELNIPLKSRQRIRYYFHRCDSSTTGAKDSHWGPLKATAKVDADSDLAILSIDSGHRSVKGLPFSSDAPWLAMDVFAIGTPAGDLGRKCSVTRGIINHISRSISHRLQDVIQFDAVVQKGNSGGPLVDNGGNLVGVAVAAVPEYGGRHYNFATPAKYLRKLMKSTTKEVGVPLEKNWGALSNLARGHDYFGSGLFSQAYREYRSYGTRYTSDGTVQAVAGLWSGIASKHTANRKTARKEAVHALRQTDSKRLRNLIRQTIDENF